MALNEHLLKVNKERFDELNITNAHKQGLTGKGIKIGIIGFSPKSHHNGAWLIQQVVPDATIIEYNVMDIETSKLKWNVAFENMINDGVQVVCCSLKKNAWGDDLKELTKRLYDKNVIMIDSSDNDYEEIKRYPAYDNRWIVVGAGDKSGRHNYSNYGENLLGLGYTNYASMNSRGDYIPISHTSGAVQVICGMASMLKQINPNITPIEFKEFISKHAIRISSEDWNEYEGWGLISLPKIIEVVQPIEESKEDENMSRFTDIDKHWAKDAIEFVAAKGLMKGYEEGQPGPADDTFRPDAPITRAELATVLARQNGYVEKK